MAEIPIKIEMLEICVRAENQPDGGLNVIGITDALRWHEFPFTVRELAIVVRFRLPTVARVVGKLGFELFDPDDRSIWHQNGTINQTTVPTREEFTTAVSNMILQFRNLHFHKAGPYDLKAYWNGSEIASTPLYILYPLPPGVPPGKGEVISG